MSRRRRRSRRQLRGYGVLPLALPALLPFLVAGLGVGAYLLTRPKDETAGFPVEAPPQPMVQVIAPPVVTRVQEQIAAGTPLQISPLTPASQFIVDRRAALFPGLYT